jgi:hypothetical protein
MSSDVVPPVPILCACGAQICEKVYVQGIGSLFHAGGGIWHELRGNCVQCGEPFYWSAKDQQIQRVIKRQPEAGGE